MKLALLAVSGPLAGTTYQLEQGETGIGRTPANAVCIDDSAVSRSHCALHRTADECVIRDLGSHNRTYVNGIPIVEKQLLHRDEIRVGYSVFVFTAHSGTALPELVANEEASLSSATVVFRAEDLRPANVRASAHLKALLRAGELIGSEGRLDPLAKKVIELVSDVIPADGVQLLLVRDGGDREVSHCFTQGRTSAEILPGILRRVIEERVSVLSNEQAVAVIAAPIVTKERVLGLLAASDERDNPYFSREDLELLTGIGSMISGGLESLMQVESLEAENARLQECLNAGGNLVGASPAMQGVQRFVWKAAPSASTVLITGESGTGKELVARAIHRNSPRSAKPFVAINCAALTESLIESELFGHEKGAFTGAISLKRGKFEEANQGTVFLDEVGELPAPMQAKLLRVLQEREFERVGGTKPIQVDIRLVAATNRDLAAMVREGSFRQDLFYRLNVVSVCIPPLRDRQDDVTILAHYFLERLAPQAGRRVAGFSSEALECLKRHDWPGNVRELQNAVERAIVLGSGTTITAGDLPESLMETALASNTEERAEFHQLVNDAKRRIVNTALDKSGGNYTEAAKELGVHPNNLHRLVRSLGIKRSASPAR